MTKNMTIKTILIGAFLSLISGCMSDGQLKDKMTKIMKENPEVLVEAIKANPADFVVALQDAAKKAQGELAKKRDVEEKKKLEGLYDAPLIPNIRADESIRGTKGGPLILVEYSDFECPFCTRGYATVVELMNKYKGKVQFIYKHLPLSFHSKAEIASRYYEAIRIQDENKAFAFHDEIFKQQRKLKNGEKFLKAIAKKVGANLKQVARDKNSDRVTKRIEEDKKEAASFGMQGTPGFLLNGIPVKGAYPASHFVGIVEELVKRGKVTL